MTLGNSRPLPDSPRRRKGYTFSDDRISDLPDLILEHILSFLPTKNAVATGILSQRWKFLWTTAINLDFCYSDLHSYRKKPDASITKFVQFVNSVLLHHKRECLNKLSLYWRKQVDPFYVNAWISAALTKNVHELFVYVRDCDIQIEVQRSMFSCQGLQSLGLTCKICFSSTEIVISLPKLESLTLDSVYFQCAESFSKLLAGCPVLKDLSISMENEVFEYFVDDRDIHVQFPRIIFSCEGLQSLEFNCNICISTEIVISLPKLESLKLVEVYFECEEAFRKIIAGCPVLKYLYIDTDFTIPREEDDVSVFRCIISCDSLRHLELNAHDYCGEDQTCSVELAAPSLVYIKLEGQISSIFILASLSSLVEANIKLVALDSNPEHDYCNLIVEALGALHCAEILTLSSHVIWALSCATVKLKTRFKRLSKLEVSIGPCCWSSLQDFMELSDNLEVLTVKEAFCMKKDRHSRCSNWKSPNQVPGCLSNSLKTFSFGGYDGGDDQLAMVGYLLKHGNALKAVQVDLKRSSVDRKKEYKLVQQISKLPMKSTVCEVEFR